MARTCKRIVGAGARLATILLLMGCQGQQSPTTGNTAANQAGSTAASANQPLRSAAEPFEALTEQAFTADWTAIDKLIADARTAVARGVLSGDKARLMEQRLAAISSAREAQDRVKLALESVEGYRELVEAQDSATADPPIAVSLLDYAGFRYDALAQAPNVDWQEMSRSVEFARNQWQSLAPKVSSKAMPGVVDQSLSAMAMAVERKDIAFARSAAANELALVDLLEEQTYSTR